MNANSIANLIKNSPKKTPVKVYVKGKLATVDFGDKVYAFISGNAGILFGDWADIAPVLHDVGAREEDYRVECDRRHSALPLLDIKNINARIEPGAVIRDNVTIEDHAVIMMGAILNIGVEIGEYTMVDMGAILGGRAKVGKRCHIGAGAVLAGVIEPPSARPVILGDGVLVGANAVILEGIQIGEGAVIAAGAIVTEDVMPFTVVAGVPARLIKKVDEKTKAKTEIVDVLRSL